MSGIAGIFQRDGKRVQPEDLNLMRDRLSVRGPDASGQWSERQVGMCHSLLLTLPEEAETSQPLCSPDGDLVITADLRLDNREELLSHFTLSKNVSDAEIVLECYRKWGTDCLLKFTGDFAFALWDKKEQRFFCARDHFGLRPFYYYLNSDLFAFGSEPKALLCLDSVPGMLNEARIGDFLSEDLEGYDKEVTFFKDIVRLPPAHFVVITPTSCSKKCYWKLNPEDELCLSNDGEYEEAFLAALQCSVRRRLRSVRPVASMLSGGMDSSSIAAVASELLRRNSGGPLHTVSCVSKAFPSSVIESEAIEQVVSHCQVQSYTIDPSEHEEYAKVLFGLIDYTEDLFDMQSGLVPLLCYNLAAKNGLNVVFDGLDGDIVAYQLHGIIKYLLRSFQFRNAFKLSSDYGKFYEESPCTELIKQGAFFWLPEGTKWSAIKKLSRRLRIQRGVKKVLRDSVISPEFAEELNLSERVEHSEESQLIFPFSSPRHWHANLLVRPLITAAIERYGRAAAACRVEARTPLFDKNFVEFCLSLPWHQKASGDLSKPLMRRSLRNHLQEGILRRSNFEHSGADFEFALWSSQKRTINETLDGSRSLLSKYVDLEKLLLARAYLRKRAKMNTPISVKERVSYYKNLAWIMQAFSLSRWLIRVV